MTAKATQFEYRHQLLMHVCVVVAAWLTYLFDPVDVVWALVQHRPDARVWERLLFAIATVLIGCGAALRTWTGARALPNRRSGALPLNPSYAGYAGSLLFAIGLGSLVPVSGFILLVTGESLLILRLILLERSSDEALVSGAYPASSLWNVFRLESAKWGIFVTMIVFTALLVDRVADVLAVVSLAVWVLLNCGSFWSRATS